LLSIRCQWKIEEKLSIIVLDAGEIFIIRTTKILQTEDEKALIKMSVIGIQIEDLIPHRGRMKWVDDVLEINDALAKTSSLVTEQWPHDDMDTVDPIMLIELVAQTAGVWEGWKSKKKDGKAGVKGWLVGIKKADFFIDRIPLKMLLVATVRRLYSLESSLESYAVFAGEVESESRLLSRVELQVFRPGAEPKVEEDQ
jgi:predicted hotdog family 3-hydroxylacyl-ACP dehydratase